MAALAYLIHTEGPTYFVELGSPSWITAMTDDSGGQVRPEVTYLAALGECEVGKPLVLELEDPQQRGGRLEHIAETVVAITAVGPGERPAVRPSRPGP